MDLHSFEKQAPAQDLRRALEAAGVRWRAHPFGRPGPLGGLWRVIRGAIAIRKASLVHARSELAAASALLARPTAWLWDMRSFWREQRIALGTLRENSVEARILATIERRAAAKSSAVVVLASAAIPVLQARFGERVASKTTVVSTCVDLVRFPSVPPTSSPRLRLLLAGTLNSFYDVPAMLRFVKDLGSRKETELTVATPGATPWEAELSDAGERVVVAPEEMPALVAAHDAGLSVCRFDAGVSLRGAMPTKIAEFLASGRPIVVSRGLGDADTIAEEHRVGVVLESGSEAHIATAATALERLLGDPELANRCRKVAEDHFSLDSAVARLIDLYRVISRPT